MPEYKPTSEEEKAIAIVSGEVMAWERGYVRITPRISFDMRNVIERSLKNYYGVFDEPKDPVTGRDKFFVPMTETIVEGIVKNVDLDTDDIKLRSGNPERLGSTAILRHILKWHLKRNYFGETLNNVIRMVAITGTQVARVVKEYDPLMGKQNVRVVPIHPLNVFVDPSAESVQHSPLVIRDVMTVAEIGRKDWKNKQYVQSSTNTDKYWQTSKGIADQVPTTEVYERWGYVPAEIIGGKKGDWVNARIIISGLGKKACVHVLRREPDGFKPFEDLRFKVISGRHAGRGIGEIVMQAQEFANEFVNIRFAGNRIRLLGLWNSRRGANVTQRSLSGLYASGVIETPRIGDIQGLVPPPIPSDALMEDRNIMSWANNAAQSYELDRGQAQPASMSATTSALQAQGARTGYALHQESIGFFLERLLERHYIPQMLKTLSEDEVMAITGDPKDLQVLDDAVITNMLNKEILKHRKTQGIWPQDTEVAQARKAAERKFKLLGDSRFVKLQKDIFDTTYSAQVYITDETINRVQMVNSLNEILRNYAAIPGLSQQMDVDLIVKEALDLLGVGGDRFFRKQETGVPAAPITPEVIASTPKAPPQRPAINETAAALTLEGAGRATA